MFDEIGKWWGGVLGAKSKRARPTPGSNPAHRDPRTHRDYSSYGIRHAAGEIAEDVVRHGFSKEWHGTLAEVLAVTKILAPFGIVYSTEHRGTWLVENTRANPSSNRRANPTAEQKWAALTAKQKRGLLAFVREMKRGSRRRRA